MQVQAKAALERGPASDLWRNTLSQIPSVFGRLIYLSALRGPNSGVYEHHGLALVFGPRAANEALRKSHHDTFRTWLSFGLQEQRLDLTRSFELVFANGAGKPESTELGQNVEYGDIGPAK